MLESIIAQEMRGVRVRSLLLAAEAARLEGQGTKAITILENAQTAHPDNFGILNNLIYNLIQHPATVPRAVELLPELLNTGNDSFAVMDTAAMVYLRSGDLAQARAYMTRALDKIDDSNYAVIEVRLNSAELDMADGRYEAARATISDVRRDARITSFLDVRARRLMEGIQKAELQEGAPKP